MAEPTLEELRAARRRAVEGIESFEDRLSCKRLVQISKALFDAAIARAERKESGEYVEVRIPYVIDERGAYSATAWTSAEGRMDVEVCVDATLDTFDASGCEAQGWITALVPKPKPTEIEGEVSDG